MKMVNLKKSHIHLLIENKLLSFVILWMYFIIIIFKIYILYLAHNSYLFKICKKTARVNVKYLSLLFGLKFD